jgi:hypothetical protein
MVFRTDYADLMPISIRSAAKRPLQNSPSAQSCGIATNSCDGLTTAGGGEDKDGINQLANQLTPRPCSAVPCNSAQAPLRKSPYPTAEAEANNYGIAC